MQDVTGRIAVVTGGGSGIGRGMALAFADAGMHVVLADIEEEAAQGVAAEVVERGARALAVRTDVTDRKALEALAERTFSEFGDAHVLCNNAGVGVLGPLETMTDDDWRWVLSVNLEGVVHGIQAFVPRMKARGEGGHIVNTASMAGLFAFPGLGVYTTTKYAVLGLSETLRLDLAPHGIGVSVLCPGLVDTRIHESTRNRPGSRGGPQPLVAGIGHVLKERGLDPRDVGRRVLEAVRADELYVFTHPEMAPLVEERFARIREAFAASPRVGRRGVGTR